MSAVLEKARSVNNEYRTAAMNRRYYACRLQKAQSLNTGLEIAVAVSSSGSIAAWSAWQTGPGVVAWKLLAAIAAIVAVAKPLLRLSKDVERFSELTVGYGALYFDMRQIVEDLRISGVMSDEIWSRYCAVRQRLKDLGIKDDLVPRKRLHRRCYDEINREIATETLWWPAEESP